MHGGTGIRRVCKSPRPSAPLGSQPHSSRGVHAGSNRGVLAGSQQPPSCTNCLPPSMGPHWPSCGQWRGSGSLDVVRMRGRKAAKRKRRRKKRRRRGRCSSSTKTLVLLVRSQQCPARPVHSRDSLLLVLPSLSGRMAKVRGFSRSITCWLPIICSVPGDPTNPGSEKD